MISDHRPVDFLYTFIRTHTRNSTISRQHALGSHRKVGQIDQNTKKHGISDGMARILLSPFCVGLWRNLFDARLTETMQNHSRSDKYMKANTWLIGGLLAAAGLSNPAWAAVAINPAPTGTLSFITPLGNVGPTDSIPVMLTLTLDKDSAPLGPINSYDFDDFAGVLPAGFIVSSAYVTYSFTHGGTFSTNGIQGPPYDFSFASGPRLSTVTLQPGESVNFEFGSFSPSNGPVAAGTYIGNKFSVIFGFIDNTQPDPNAAPGAADGWDTYLTIANTCDGCFQRTVVAAVPEPETYAMLLAGLGVMGWIVRRRRGL